MSLNEHHDNSTSLGITMVLDHANKEVAMLKNTFFVFILDAVNNFYNKKTIKSDSSEIFA